MIHEPFTFNLKNIYVFAIIDHRERIFIFEFFKTYQLFEECDATIW